MAARELGSPLRAASRPARRGLLAALFAGAAGLGALTGCAVVETRIYDPGVVLAPSDEGRACYRQCLQIANSGGLSCSADSFRQVGDGLFVHERVLTGRYAAEFGCPGMVTDCMLSCPGAKLSAEGPSWRSKVKFVGLPEPVEGDDDEDEPEPKPAPTEPDDSAVVPPPAAAP